mmetsp:Transcript_29928/g.75390  ORF Transcript_29928/g.75390 Transcript_29928/m.75390 type:complete len:209 (-) Transcript_29928:178-804(-)
MRWWGPNAPLLEQHRDPVAADEGERRVDVPGDGPGRLPHHQHEGANSAREDVSGCGRVAVGLRGAGLARDGVGGKEHLAPALVVGHLRHAAREAVVGADDLHHGMPRDVHLWRPVHPLPRLCEVPQRRTVEATETDRLAEVRQDAIATSQEDVLEREVSMADVAAVQVLHRLQELRDVAFFLALRQRLPTSHALEQLASLAILGHHVG